MQAVKTKQQPKKTELTEQEFNYLWYFRSVFIFLLGVDIIIFDRVSNQPLFYWGVLLVLVGGIANLYFNSEIEWVRKSALSGADIRKIACINELQTRWSGVLTTTGMYNGFHFAEKERVRNRWFRASGIVRMNSATYPLVPWNSLCALVKDKANEPAFNNAFEHRAREILFSPDCTNSYKDEARRYLMTVFAISPHTVLNANLFYVPVDTLLKWRDCEDTDGFTPESRFAVITEITRRSIPG